MNEDGAAAHTPKAPKATQATKAPVIHAVSRAIALLRALNRQPVSTVEALYQQTCIPKPSIVRLLRTFEAEGLVQHAAQYGAYVLTSGVADLTCGFHGEPRILQAVAPVVDALTMAIKWPLAVGVLDTDAVVVRHSTIPLSPLSFLHSSIGMRLSLVSRALGRAYLAFCSAEEQAVLLALVARSSQPEDTLARQPESVMAMLAEVRARGYALRDPSIRPVSQTIAVPIFDGGHVAATMGLTWFTGVHSAQTVVERYLSQLRGAADEAGERLVALRQGRANVSDAPYRLAE